jgi:predicted nucleic acid-binding protein
MKIYSDSSFLVSLIYPGDPQHQKARAFFSSNQNEDWITSEWSQFETINGLRQLCKKHNGPQPSVAEGLRRLFKHWHEKGAFRLEGTDLNEAVAECQQMSAAQATKLRMRSADVLHVAILEQVNPDLFVTRDKEQHDLAMSRAFKSVLIP